MRVILCILAVALNSVCNADDAVGKQPQAELATRQEIADLMERYRAVGLAVAVVKDAELVYCDSFGFRNLEAKTPLEDRDLFRIASISKSFSATSVMQLVEAEKLSLESDVSDLIGTIIERVSGERFDQYVHHHLLKPPGLTGGFAVDALDASRFATLYEYDADKRTFTPSPTAYHARREEIQNYVSGYSTPIFSPAGGMKMSARDLSRYMSMQIGMGEVGGTRVISRDMSNGSGSVLTYQTAVLRTPPARVFLYSGQWERSGRVYLQLPVLA